MREQSAGMVLFRGAGARRKYLLLHYPSGHWDFVKGRLEPGETEKEAAVREAEEETGITDVEFVDGFEERIEYVFERRGRKVRKGVTFFLAETRATRVTISDEHTGHAWAGYGAAVRMATFENARGVLERAAERLG